MKEEYLQLAFKNGSAWYGHGKFAIKLVETLKPEITVELGVEYGYSSFSFAYPKIGKVYGVDWFKGDVTMGMKNNPEHTKIALLESYNEMKSKYGIDNIDFIESEFDELAKIWDKKIDILHIDGCHTYDAVKNDYQTWIKFCNTESVVLFHDTLSFRNDVGRFFDELEGYKYNREPWSGLGVITQSKRVYDIIGEFINE